MNNQLQSIIISRLTEFGIRVISSILKSWVPTWTVVTLFIFSFLGIILWFILMLLPIEIPLTLPIQIKTYLPIPIFTILFFLSALLIILRADLGIVYFSPTWRNQKDFEKKFIESKKIKKVWYMTTVGRFYMKEANAQQKIAELDEFRCLLLDPWSKEFDKRMDIERPKYQSKTEPRRQQLHYCKSILSLGLKEVHLRWYNFEPKWRLMIFDERYVAVGWFPDYSKKPKSDENKGYNGPLFILDNQAIRRHVKIKSSNIAKLQFPMSLLADAFIKYFQSVWQLAGEDLAFAPGQADKIETEKTIKTLHEIGVSHCWRSEEESPYSFLSVLGKPNLKSYRYLELSAHFKNNDTLIKYLPPRQSEQLPIKCFIMLYDPRSDWFKSQILSEKSTVDDAILKQDFFIIQLINALKTEAIGSLQIKFLNEPPFFRSVIAEFIDTTDKLLLGYYTKGVKGYKNQLWKLEGKNNKLLELHLSYFINMWDNRAIEFDFEKYREMREKTSLLNFLKKECPI